MSSDKSQSAVGGTATAIGSVGPREGALTDKDKRIAIQEAPVSARQQDDLGDVLELSLSSVFKAKTDGQLKNLSGEALIEEMRNNPLTQAKSGEAWAQVNITKAGRSQELAEMIEGKPVVKERAALENIQTLLGGQKTLTELSPLQVRFLQDNLKTLRLYKGSNDGDFTNPKMVAALDSLVKAKDTLQKVMDRNGGRLAIDFAWSVRHPEFQQSQKPAQDVPSGEAKIMAMFKETGQGMTAALASVLQTQPEQPRHHAALTLA